MIFSIQYSERKTRPQANKKLPYDFLCN